MMIKLIIYGAGESGKWCYDFLKWRGLSDRVYGFCDKNFESIREIDGVRVFPYNEVKKLSIPFVVAIIDRDTQQEVLLMLSQDGNIGYAREDMYKALNEEQVVFLREWCAYHHAKHNDAYFDGAEDKSALNVFWEENTPFYQYFKTLDLSNVIELACGRGRHVQKYVECSAKVTLVDILEENMIICKERYKQYTNIEYYHNNGFNLEKLPSETYSALFSYDSMVHFELMDVNKYLKDIYRVMKKGGKVLLHHSNYSEDYKTDFSRTRHARCFMDKKVFAYLAYRAGFKVKDQTVIDWYGQKNLDCITLLEK